MHPGPLLLTPEYRQYVWGGSRLRPEITPTAEAWVVYGGNRVQGGPYHGQSLDELTAAHGPALLGRRVRPDAAGRFPLLVKLLDCAQWLSVQVHPDDEQAHRLAGPGASGKTEAWHILEAAPGATLIAGVRPGVSAKELAISIRNGHILEYTQSQLVKAGDTIFMPAGAVHALGPGLLVYEIQQTSDITYRVYDWGRPQSAGRQLHIEQALAVARPEARPAANPTPPLPDGQSCTLVECPYFRLELLQAGGLSLTGDTAGDSFQALTVIHGRARLHAAGEVVELNRFETVLLPAACGDYRVEGLEGGRILRAGVG